MVKNRWRRWTRVALGAAVVAAGFSLAAPADAARRAFPGGWVNPAGSASFDDWGFGTCHAGYSTTNAHLGADSQGYKSGPVRSMAAGTVRAYVSWGTAWGNALAIEHTTTSGVRFVAVYGHVNSSLRPGARVSAGQSIATLYNLGSNTHVHLGIRPLASGQSASSVAIKGMSTGCKPVNALGYVDPIPWLAARRPAGTAPVTPAPAGRTATVRTWSAPWTVITRNGPSTSHARIGSYADGARVQVVCQYRNGQTITDYYGPKNATISWPVWNRTNTGHVFPDLYSDLPANPGLPNC